MARKASPPYKVGVVGIKGAGGMGGSHTRAAKLHPKAEVVALLQPLTAADNPWRFAAGEVLAYVDLKDGARAQALADRAVALLFYIAVGAGTLTFAYW